MKQRVPLSGNKPTTPYGATPTEQKRPDGQNADHWVLPSQQREVTPFVRPVRRSYRHLVCGTVTSMPQAIAETYAVNPGYYARTFCCGCGDYYAVGESGQFVWDDGSNQKVGS